MKRFTVRLLIAGALVGVLSFSLQLFDPLPWTGFLTSHAQERQTQKFFVFDGHSHTGSDSPSAMNWPTFFSSTHQKPCVLERRLLSIMRKRMSARQSF